MKLLNTLVRKSQKNLKKYLTTELRKYYKTVVSDDGFLYAKGSDICLTAHMDTVHKELVKEIVVEHTKDGTKISSPQGIGGDDRCGVWMILKVLQETDYRPSIIFCEDEEIGSVGAHKFVKTKYVNDLSKMKYIVELDRRNGNDAVFYECDNKKFHKYIQDLTGYKKTEGSFSDICVLSDAADIASVNLSCGYYHEHHLDHYIIFEEMVDTFLAVEKLLADEKEVEQFDYEPIVWLSKSFDYGLEEAYVIIAGDNVGEYFASSQEEALGMFMIEHPTVCFNDVFGVLTSEEYYNLLAMEDEEVI